MSSLADDKYEKLPVGGDFAGLVAKFCSKDGSLIPVPEHLIPEELLEWGQEPSSLEVLVSEEWNGEKGGNVLFQRQSITVLPATGCGVDNLETMKSEKILNEKDMVQWSQPSESTLVLDETTVEDKTSKYQLETQFSLPVQHRVRVSLDLLARPEKNENEELSYSYEIQSPIIVHLERQSNTTSSKGTRADGGGLDGRTVFTLLGDWLKQSHSFAEKKPSAKRESGKDDQAIFATSTSIRLPGNITITSRSEEERENGWIMEVSHFTSGTEGSSPKRRIVQRKFENGLVSSATNYRVEM